jgi:hypothetical protein
MKALAKEGGPERCGAPLERPDAVRPAIGEVEHADGGLDVDHVFAPRPGTDVEPVWSSRTMS